MENEHIEDNYKVTRIRVRVDYILAVFAGILIAYILLSLRELFFEKLEEQRAEKASSGIVDIRAKHVPIEVPVQDSTEVENNEE